VDSAEVCDAALSCPKSPLELGLIVERRLLTFIVASTAFFLVYITLRSRFAPPQENQDPVVAEAPAVDQAGVPAVDEEAGEASGSSES